MSARPEALAALAAEYSAVPPAYLDFLRGDSGAEGDVGVPPGWIQFWSPERVLQFNALPEIVEFLPDFVCFANGGDGELIAFDTRAAPWRIVVLPPGSRWQARGVQVAADFATFARHFGESPPAG